MAFRPKNKYRNETQRLPCIYGIKHRSALEYAVCNMIHARVIAGELEHVGHEKSVYLTLARYRCIPDFVVRDTSTGEVYYIEAKGDHRASRFPTTSKLWKFYGPGRMEIYKGKYRGGVVTPYLWKVITPDRAVD